MLEQEEIPIPAVRQKELGFGAHKNKEFKNTFKWESSTVACILDRLDYIGVTVNHKTKTVFKDNRSHYVDKESWQIVEDTHEPIIDKDIFEQVQTIR